MIGFLLLIFAWVLIPPITIINVIMVASKAGIRGWVRSLGGYFKRTARNLDIFGADEYATFWNVTVVKNGGEKFTANKGKTISYHLGSNQLTGTLTAFGRFIAWCCDTIDTDHCHKAYENEKD